MAPSASQNASCARATVFLLDEGAPAVLLLRAWATYQGSSSPVSTTKPSVARFPGNRILNFKRDHSGVSKPQGSRSSTTAIDTVQLSGLQAATCAAGSAQGDARPGTVKRIRSQSLPLCGNCGSRCPGMTQASPLARFGPSGLPPGRRDSKRLLRPFLSHRRASPGSRPTKGASSCLLLQRDKWSNSRCCFSMRLCAHNAAHQGWTLIFSLRPVPRQIPVVIIFPPGSVGARTPGAHDLETYGLTSFARRRWIPQPDRPSEVEQPTLPLNRPLQGPPVGRSFELEDGLLQSKFVCVLRSRFINGRRAVVAKASICP
jgi:hypothetical protein